MDVLYILGKGSKWDNNEIRYSLRSLEKHGQGFNRVFITGENPGFTKNIEYNYCPDIGYATINHMHKVRWTFQNTDISDDIILMYDDVYFMQDVQLNEYPYRYTGELYEKPNIARGFVMSMYKCRKMLENLNKPTKNYGVHCPFIYNRQKFLSLNQYWDKMNRGFYFSVRSFYGNYHEVNGVKSKDAKVIQPRDIKITGQDFFSISDFALDNGLDKYLEKLYDKKSKYEK